jgi:hypothetical protein
MIKGLSVEQRMQLMDVLIPEDEFAGSDPENEENEKLNQDNQE